MSEFRFDTFENFEDWADAQSGPVSIAHTSGESKAVFLTVRGKVVAHVKKELRGATAQETLDNIKGINLTIATPPKDPATGEVGLPTLMQDKSEWDTLVLR